MDGDILIVEQTATGYEQTWIPAEVRELERLNNRVRANRAAQERISAKRNAEKEKRRKAEEQARAAKWRKIKRIFLFVFGYIVCNSILAILAHQGLVNVNVAWAAFAALSLYFGWRIGANT